jgi:hypothetical protein
VAAIGAKHRVVAPHVARMGVCQGSGVRKELDRCTPSDTRVGGLAGGESAVNDDDVVHVVYMARGSSDWV